MSVLHAQCSEIVRQLFDSLSELESESSLLRLSPLQGREWYELLKTKLLPQLVDDGFLVVAVVGGTNIGKSVIFNHLVGNKASSTSPLASGTKHPVCLMPPQFPEKHNLNAIFPGFKLTAWNSAEQALDEISENLLFWRTSTETPENLLVLDTPDIDSDAQVNWQRADGIRRSADVLIAVLTQQKYNDAIVKQFFRKAAVEDKAIIVIFNQCQLPEDEDYWPLWLKTFCTETGVKPEFVYIAPNDRAAAEENRLTFFERAWPIETAADSNNSDSPRNLMQDLSSLHFPEIKVRSLRGSLLQLCHPEAGVPHYLSEIDRQSQEFRSAAELLSSHRLAEIDNWPPVPNSVLVAEIRCWWQAQREGWSGRVHHFYNGLGAGLVWPFRFAKEKIVGPETPPLEIYRKREWSAILETVEKVYERLQWMSELGNDLLKPRLESILSGQSRADLLKILQEQLDSVDLDLELEQLICSELETFREESPDFYLFLKRLDQTAAVARPVTSIMLFVTGFGPAGNAAAQLATDTAIQSVVHVAGDVAGGTVAAAVGETAISSSASSSLGYIEAKFRKLHSAFIAKRASWLGSMLKTYLLGELPEELQKAACLPESSSYQEVQKIVQQLEKIIPKPETLTEKSAQQTASQTE